MFLDNEANEESIRLQYKIWLTRARERGSAIAIGHPYASTIEVLNRHLPGASDEFRFMRVSKLIEERRIQNSSARGSDQLSTLETLRQ